MHPKAYACRIQALKCNAQKKTKDGRFWAFCQHLTKVNKLRHCAALVMHGRCNDCICKWHLSSCTRNKSSSACHSSMIYCKCGSWLAGTYTRGQQLALTKSEAVCECLWGCQCFSLLDGTCTAKLKPTQKHEASLVQDQEEHQSLQVACSTSCST